ncbi:thermonuclease family protein [Rhodobacterales bacterium]|nr:thermonuclease family protein [Rhodobacterales bacterium]
MLAFLLLVEPPALPEGRAGDTAPHQAEPVAEAQQTADAEPVASVIAAPRPDQIRNVSPEGVSAPRVSGFLKRIEPSKRYQELKNPPVEPVPDGPLELFRVEIIDSGHIRSGRMKVTLANITGLAPEATCKTRSGTDWPCGMRARTFLRGLVRQLRLDCVKQQEIGPQEIVASCRRGQIDLSARLVRYGWATPAADAPQHFQELALKAKEAKAGQWQDEWVTDLPDSGFDDSGVSALPDLENLTQEVVEWSQSAAPGLAGQDLVGSDSGAATLVPNQ